MEHENLLRKCLSATEVDCMSMLGNRASGRWEVTRSCDLHLGWWWLSPLSFCSWVYNPHNTHQENNNTATTDNTRTYTCTYIFLFFSLFFSFSHIFSLLLWHVHTHTRILFTLRRKFVFRIMSVLFFYCSLHVREWRRVWEEKKKKTRT